MANKNLTVFQAIGQVLGPNGIKNKPQQPAKQTQRYNIGQDVLLKTTDKKEYETAKLQAQQNKYLGQMWKKVEHGLFQQAVNYETSRIGSYSDFEAMEFYPEIAAALDIMMEESTTLNNDGRMINVYSDSKRVKGIVEDLMFNRLDIHTALPMWTRNTPVREDSIIPLLDGTEITIKELSNRVKSGEEIWSYAIQDGTKAIVPSKIIWCDLTRKDSELIRVTLDDGTHLDTTPDHEYMLRDGSYKRADKLTSGQSLMPFYTRKSEKKKDCIVGYEKIYNPSTTKYKFTHSLVAHECVRNLENEKLIGGQFDTHHVDFNKLNNHPNNLVRLTHSDHFKLHIDHFDKILGSPEITKKRMLVIDKYLRSNKRKERLSKKMTGIYPKYFEEYNNSNLHSKHNEIRSEGMFNNWKLKEFKEKTRNRMTIDISDRAFNYISNTITNFDGYLGINKLSEILNIDNDFIQLFKENYTLRKDIVKSINPTTLTKVLFKKTNQNYFDFVLSIKPSLILDKEYIKAKAIYLGKTKSKVLLNHKVVSVIKLNETSDVYCLEAVGLNGEHDRHNFPVLGKDVTGSYSRTSGVFLANCKYGDNFVYLNIDEKQGVTGAKQMPNYEMERRDGGLFDMISQSNTEEYKTDKTKFYWRGRDVEFNSWQIAHFRLLGDDRRLPYGTSMLEKARRIWKQLLLSEDAMLVYRVTRAPERRIYKIYVGNIDDKDVAAYVNEIANRFKRTPMVDPQTGQVDLRYNQLPVWKNTPIPLLDGRTITIEELANEYNNGKENYVYSVKDNTNEIVGGKVIWCGKNYTAEKMIKIWLDDDTYVVTAPEHPFVLRDGTSKRADELTEGQSLMPFYKKEESFNNWKNSSKYETVYNPNTGKYEFTHRLIAKENIKNDIKHNTIHHINFNSKDNTPTNLQWVDYKEHIGIHSEIGKKNWAEGKMGKVVDKLIDYNKSDKKRLRNVELAKEQNWGNRFVEYNNSELHTEHNIIRKEAQLKDWSTPEKKEFRSKAMQVVFDNFIWNNVRTNIINKKINNRKTLIEFLNTAEILNHTLSINTNKRLHNQKRIERTVVERILKNEGFNTITDYITANQKNHKVKFTEIIDGDDVYCMTVVGQNGEENRHNFATLSFSVDGNISNSGVFVKNSNDQDYFIPVRSEDAPNPIDTLPGAANLDQIADIEYLQKKLFTALRVPKPFLGFDDTTGEGKNLALQDIRFSRTVNRIQQAMLQELNKIVIIHLYLLGFEEDLDNFTLTLNNPSTQAEMLKIEHLQLKMTLYKDAVSDAGNGFGAMSMTRARREIFGWSDNDIKQDLLEQRMEKAAAAELANSANVIKHTGMFDIVDRIYGDMKLALKGGGTPPEEGGEGGGGAIGGGGGGFGGGGVSPDDLDFGDEGEDGEDAEMGGEAGGDAAGAEPEIGGDAAAGAEPADATEPQATTAEEINKINALLTEQKKILNEKLASRSKKYNNRFFTKLIDSVDHAEKSVDSIKIVDKNVRINETVNTMIKDIDDMLK